jgi:hypothetical protein
VSLQIDSILEVGIDYITATNRLGEHHRSFHDFGLWLVAQEADKGESRNDWRFSAYRGARAGRAAYGRRYDGSCVRLSGAVAAEHWAQLTTLATNVSRLDLQVTVCPDGGPTKRLASHYRQLRRKNRGRGRPAKVKLWVGLDGPECLEVGKRVSNRYLRVYDKAVQSKLPYYLGALRYEAELKNETAWVIAQSLNFKPDEAGEICSYVSMLARNRGLHISLAAGRSVSDLGAGHFRLRSEAYLGEADRKVMWIRNCVRPSVLAFLARGERGVVLDALGLVDHGFSGKWDSWSTGPMLAKEV